MKPYICVALFGLVPLVLSADAIKLTKEELIAKQGGEVIKRGTFTGKVAIINEQRKLSVEDIQKAIGLFVDVTGCNFMMSNDGKDATITLTVIDDAKSPKMLIAPDDRWGRVNLANLVDDLPSAQAKQKFFTIRARKMIIRALSLLCGGGASSFSNNIMSAVTLRDLDYATESIPVDMEDRYREYLPKVGVTKKETVPYKRACREGWAPAPTNDVQRKIWDDVHAAPKTPMKIEFDPKKGR